MLTIEVGPRAVPTTEYFVSLHNGWQVPQQSTLTSGRGILSGSSPTGSAPIPLSWSLSSEAQLRNGFGVFNSNI